MSLPTLTDRAAKRQPAVKSAAGAAQLDLDVRILTVCDVFDALRALLGIAERAAA